MEPTSEPQMPVTPQPQNSNKLLYAMIGVLGLLIIAAGSLYFVISQKKQTPTMQPKQAVQPTPQVQPSQPVTDEFAGWKKITNKNGFSFMYPESVEVFGGAAVEEKPEETTTISIREKGVKIDGPRMHVTLWDSKEPSDSQLFPSSFKAFAEAWYKDNVENPNVPVTIVENLHEVSMLGQPGYEFTFNCKGFEVPGSGSPGPNGTCRIVFINKNGIFYSIGFYKNTIFDKIFSTFKFTNQNQQVDTANWKKYLGTHFSFSYPTSWTAEADTIPNSTDVVETARYRISQNAVFEAEYLTNDYASIVEQRYTGSGKASQVTFGGNEGTRIQLDGSGATLPEGYSIINYIIKGLEGKSYTIIFNGDRNDITDQLINQVMSTFTFVN